MRCRGLRRPNRRANGSERGGGARKRPRARIDGERRLIDAAQLLGIRMNMHEPLLWRGNVEKRVAAGRHLAEPRPQRDHEIAFLNAPGKRRIDADADVAGIAGMRVVEAVLAAEAAADGELVVSGKARDGGDAVPVPRA